VISDSVPAQTPEPQSTGGEPSITPAPRPRWLIPAAAAVLVLAAAIGVVVGLTLTNQRAGAGAAGAASYVPAEASVYYEIRFDPSVQQRANLRAFLGHFSKLDPDKYLTDELDQQLDSMSPQASGAYRYSTDVKPWFDGTVAVALIGYPSMVPQTPSATVPRIPEALVFAGVNNASAANSLNDRIRADAANKGATVRATAHGSATIWSVEIPVSSVGSPPTFAWTITGNEVMAGTSVDLVGRALDVHAGAPSLENRQEFRDGLARLPADRVGLFSVDTAPIVAQITKDVAAVNPSLTPLVQGLNATPQGFVVEAARFEADRFVIDATASLSAAPPPNLDPGLLALVPGDALFYTEAFDAGTGLANVVNVMKATITAGGGSSSEQIDQLEQVLGGDLGSFVSWMGDTALVAGETSGAPYAGLIITPKDSAQARTKLLQIQGLIQLSQASGGPKVTVSEAEHHGSTITTIHVDAGATTPSWATTYQYTVSDSRVVIGVGDTFVARVLDTGLGTSLGQDSRFYAALQSVGGTPNRGTFWLDLAGLRAALEPLLPAEAKATYQSEVQPWVAPFDYAIGAVRSDGQRSETHFALVVK